MTIKYKNNINNLRKQIDNLDLKLVLLLVKRFVITRKIISLKKITNLPIKDKNRETNILTRVGKLAKKFGINQSFMVDMYKKILKESKRQ